MRDAEKIRSDVAQAYARVVNAASSCCGESIPGGATAQLAGYRPEDLAAVPPDVEIPSFGCGNPLAFGEVRPGQIVLDLGSGAGLDLLIAARKVGPTGRVIGIDMTDAMITRARANVAAAGVDNVEIRKGLIEELPVESASVDWVISNCVINLSPEKDRVFAELFRVLKPGGRVSISDIVVEDLPAYLRDNPGFHCACIGGAIPEKSYLEKMSAAGLADARVEERIVYTASQIEELAGSEIEKLASPCCPPSKAQVQAIAAEIEGKIWSGKFSAQKP